MRRGSLPLVLALLAGGAATGFAASPDEDEDALYPFPPGANAALTRQVCTNCHSANVVTRRKYDEEEATRFYRLMIGDVGNDNARRIIAYLSTTLGYD